MERNLAGDSTPTLKWKKVAYGGMQIGYRRIVPRRNGDERQRREARFAQGDERFSQRKNTEKMAALKNKCNNKKDHLQENQAMICNETSIYTFIRSRPIYFQ
ncbi:unnamed protein product [Microthlaspi erraticum]|uniref:Uncharacterized protein n=1 Tax=Microthlaspi erraticum TaxID=1685480 RepID=A0A6D2L1H0_9BRAS|nr:unnamed protein product [Microthlaspi erraticum]